LATPWEQSDGGEGRIKLRYCKKLLPGQFGARHVHERVSNVLHRNARLAVHRFLEVENAKHLCDVGLDFLETSLAPGPNLRADEINHRDAALLEFSREAKIEIGKINEDSESRLLDADLVEKRMERPVNPRQP